jgi:hypothetical protein
MPNIDHLNRNNTESKFNRTTPRTLDREQLEYSAQKMLTYGVILFAVVLGLGSVTYMTVQQLKK